MSKTYNLSYIKGKTVSFHCPFIMLHAFPQVPIIISCFDLTPACLFWTRCILFQVVKQNSTTGNCLSLHSGDIHVYGHYFRTSLKPLGDPKAVILLSLLGRGWANVYLNGPDHMTKIAAAPIYG